VTQLLPRSAATIRIIDVQRIVQAFNGCGCCLPHCAVFCPSHKHKQELEHRMKTHMKFKHILLSMTLMVWTGIAFAADSSSIQEIDLTNETPSGVIELKSTSVRLLAGGSWGDGTLHYQGKAYPFKVKGLSVGGIGIKAIDAIGEVYFLDRLEDFAGNYGTATVGATAYKGATKSTYNNNQGVVITLKAKTKGVSLTLGISGMMISMQ
jgi:hypothetical protein